MFFLPSLLLFILCVASKLLRRLRQTGFIQRKKLIKDILQTRGPMSRSMIHPSLLDFL